MSPFVKIGLNMRTFFRRHVQKRRFIRHPCRVNSDDKKTYLLAILIYKKPKHALLHMKIVPMSIICPKKIKMSSKIISKFKYSYNRYEINANPHN